jgi:hypothetical protein
MEAHSSHLQLALLIVAMILILGGALSAPPKIKIIAGLSNALQFDAANLKPRI